MSEKKTTRKKTTSAGRRASTSRKKKSARRDETPESAVTAPVEAAPETAAAGPPRRRRAGAGRKGGPKPPAEASRVVAGPEVAEEDGEIVIQFPPVAPPPFIAPPPRTDGAAVAAPPAGRPAELRAEPARAEPVRTEPARVEPSPEPAARRPEPAPAPPAPPAQRAEQPRPGPPEPAWRGEAATAGLSPSQKRRLRRRRRRSRDLAGGAPAAAEAAGREAPRPEKDHVAAGAGVPAGRPPEAEGLGPDEDFDPALAAAEAIEAAESEPGVVEELEPAELAEEIRAEETEAAEAELAVEAAEGAREPEAAVAEAAEAREGPPERRRRGRRRRRRVAAAEAPAVTVAAEAEAEARPAGVVREMVINAVPREECRIAILCNGKLEEIYLERAAAESHVGNIYKGVVTNVEPSIQAAFIDFGQGKNGFLHISDLHPQYFPDGAGQTENVGHKLPRRHRPPIQRCLRRGQEVLVQVTKEGIGTKGPTLSTYLSIPGRFLVMMPGMRRLGVSRRIEDDGERDTLRALLSELELPEGMGFIARTAALGRNRKELQNDLAYLSRLWRAVEKRIKNDPAPAELYRESDLVIRTIRDVFTSDVERIVVDDAEVAERAREFLSIFSPRSQDIVTLYSDPMPIFHKYGVEAELERLHSRHVPLRSGGSLVIDQTEALVAIDVNSGRFRTEDDAEQTAFKINLEAADEIARQLRLRDLGGVVVCDFIDMRQESHRREVERRLIRNLKEHKERAKVLRMSAFGMIELTRQRQRASLTRSVYQDCRHCRGTGLVKTMESVALDVMRLIQLCVSREHIQVIEVSVAPEVAFLLQNRKRGLLAALESKFRRTISIRPEPNFSADQVEVRCTDARGRIVPHT